MSKKNRLMIYEKLKAAGQLDKDDGSLEKEFGTPSPKPESTLAPKTSKVSGKGKK